MKSIEERAAEIAAKWQPLTERQLTLLSTTFRPAPRPKPGGKR